MNSVCKKIYIIGPAGSGKSTLAEKLSHRYTLPILDLDDIFWREKYSLQNSLSRQKDLLEDFLEKNKQGWIIEGAEPEFASMIAQEANQVIWLKKPVVVLFFRLIKRFIKNQEQEKNTKNEKIKNYWKLILGIISYNRKNNLYRLHERIFLSQRTTN